MTRTALSPALIAIVSATIGHVGLASPVRLSPFAQGRPLFAQTATIRIAPDEPGSLESRAEPVTPQNPVPKRLRADLPAYPPDSPSHDLHATITLRLVIDGAGRVGEMRFLRPASTSFQTTPGRGVRLGSLAAAAREPHVLEPFVRAATSVVRQWQYEPPAVAPLAFDITLAFHPGAETEIVAHGLTTRGTFSAGSTGTYTIGPAFTDPPPTWPPAAYLEPTMLAPRVVKRVGPVYPIVALQEGVEGVVLLQARVGLDGHVTHARVTDSIPLLDAAALEAMMQWAFTPPRINGAPSAVLITVSMRFTIERN